MERPLAAGLHNSDCTKGLFHSQIEAFRNEVAKSDIFMLTMASSLECNSITTIYIKPGTTLRCSEKL